MLDRRMVAGDGGIEDLHVVKHRPQVIFLGLNRMLQPFLCLHLRACS